MAGPAANIFVTGGVGFIGEQGSGRGIALLSRYLPLTALPSLRSRSHLDQSCAGSHTVLVLLEHGFKVVLMDNLDNSFQKAYDRMVELAGDKASNMKFIKVNRATTSCCGARRRLAARSTADRTVALHKLVLAAEPERGITCRFRRATCETSRIWRRHSPLRSEPLRKRLLGAGRHIDLQRCAFWWVHAGRRVRSQAECCCSARRACVTLPPACPRSAGLTA